jgi:hypothetical protein
MDKPEFKPLFLTSGKRVFLTPTGDCAVFNEDFDYYCFENGLGAVLDRDGAHAPRKPVDELRRERRNYARKGDEKIISTYYDRMDSWTTKIVRIIGLFRQSVHADIWLHVQQIVRNYEERTLQKFFQIREEVNAAFGGYTIAKGLDNFRRIQEVPEFTSTASVSYGVTSLAKLFKERAGWGNRQQSYQDDTKIPILREKMGHWNKLEYVLNEVDENDETYDQLVRRLLRKNKLMTNQDNAEQIKEAGEKKLVDQYLAKRDLAKQEGINRSLAMHAMGRSVREINEQLLDQQQWSKNEDTSMSDCEIGMQLVNRGDDLYHYVPMAQVAAWMMCHNCGEQHMVKDCTKPFCIQCNKKWSSDKSDGYHNPLQCPTNPMDLRYKSSGRQGISGGRGGQGQNKIAGRGYGGRGTPVSALGKRSGDTAGGSAKRPSYVNFMPPVAHAAVQMEDDDKYVAYDVSTMDVDANM